MDKAKFTGNVVCSAGGTGGPGGNPPRAGNPVEALNFSNPDQTVDEFAQEVTFIGFVSETGGHGQIPTTAHEAREKGISAGEMRKEQDKAIEGISTVEQAITEVKARYAKFTIVEKKANSVMAFHALGMGRVFIRMRELHAKVVGHRDWISFANAQVPEVSKRSREKYVNIAALPGVEDHLAYGVEALAEFGSHYASLNQAEKAGLGENPILTYLSRRQFSLDTPYEERKLHLDAVVQVKKLDRQGIFLSVELMERFLRSFSPLTKEERAYLKSLPGDPVSNAQKYVEAFVSSGKTRDEFAPKQNTDQSSQASSSINHEVEAQGTETGLPPKPLTIPNLDVQVATLEQSLAAYLTPDSSELPGTVDVDALERVARQALELAQKLRKSTVTANN